MKKTVLQVDHLSKSFLNSGGKEENEVLNDLSLSVEENEFVSILGPSGCGKTTFLRCVAGFENYSGQILMDGEPITGPGMDRIMVFQDFNQLFPWKTVEKNIQHALKMNGIKDRKLLKEKSDTALHKVKLDGYQNYYPFQLSGGMKQRVAIAKAFALKPKLILMDEPFAALDAMTRNRLQKKLLELHAQEQCTILFITHNILEAIALGTRVIVLQTGGNVVVDQQNPISRPVTPDSPGYGPFWTKLHDALYETDHTGAKPASDDINKYG